MNKNKKILLSLGTLLVATAPVATAISCGDDDNKAEMLTTEQLKNADVKVVTDWSLNAMKIDKADYTGDIWTSTATRDITADVAIHGDINGKEVVRGTVSIKDNNLIIIVSKDKSFPISPENNFLFTYTYTFDLVKGRLIDVALEVINGGNKLISWNTTFDALMNIVDKDAEETTIGPDGEKVTLTREKFLGEAVPLYTDPSFSNLTASELKKAGTTLGIKTGETDGETDGSTTPDAIEIDLTGLTELKAQEIFGNDTTKKLPAEGTVFKVTVNSDTLSYTVTQADITAWTTNYVNGVQEIDYLISSIINKFASANTTHSNLSIGDAVGYSKPAPAPTTEIDLTALTGAKAQEIFGNDTDGRKIPPVGTVFKVTVDSDSKPLLYKLTKPDFAQWKGFYLDNANENIHDLVSLIVGTFSLANNHDKNAIKTAVGYPTPE